MILMQYTRPWHKSKPDYTFKLLDYKLEPIASIVGYNEVKTL